MKSHTPFCLFCYLPHLRMVLPSPYIQSWNVVHTSWGKSWFLLSSFPPGLEFSFQNDLEFVSSVSSSVFLVTCPQQCSDVWLPPLHRGALWCCGTPVLLARKCVFHWAPSGFFFYLSLLLSLSSSPSFGVTLAGYNEMSDVRMHSLSFSIFQSCGLTPRRCLKHTETLSAVPPSLFPFPPKLSFCSQLLSHPFRSQIASPGTLLSPPAPNSCPGHYLPQQSVCFLPITKQCKLF